VEDRTHPDQVQAVSMLRELAIGDGSHAPAVREAVRPWAVSALAGWDSQPHFVKQALVWLATAFPDLAENHPEVSASIPSSMRSVWLDLLHSSGRLPDGFDDLSEQEQDQFTDRETAFQAWALAGWTSQD
jgi:hypothetical protein